MVLVPPKNGLSEVINAAMVCVEATGGSDEQREVTFKLAQQRTTSLRSERHDECKLTNCGRVDTRFIFGHAWRIEKSEHPADVVGVRAVKLGLAVSREAVFEVLERGQEAIKDAPV